MCMCGLPTARYRAGDWKCPACGYSNFASNKACGNIGKNCKCLATYGLHAYGDDSSTSGRHQATLTAKPGGGGANCKTINAIFNARIRGDHEVMRE
eukprot:2621428-Heterocapsa_arctica.AAC.2